MCIRDRYIDDGKPTPAGIAETLRNLIALMRAMGMLDRLADLIPPVEAESPMEILERERRTKPRKRAPRTTKN